MKNWLANLFSRQSPPSPAATTAPAVDALRLQTEVQSLRMELEARERTIDNLKQETERLRLRQDELLNDTVALRMEKLFNDLAAPASQILTQADLLEKQGKPVQARDVLSVARRMVRALERSGLSFEGQVGQAVEFDPNRHTPMQGGAQPALGQPVTVRFVGAAYQGKIIYKAIVE